MYNVRMFIHHKRNFFIGILILLLVLSGLPEFWKFFLIIVAAIALAVFSIKFKIPNLFVKDTSNLPAQTEQVEISPTIANESPKPKRVRRKRFSNIIPQSARKENNPPDEHSQE